MDCEKLLSKFKRLFIGKIYKYIEISINNNIEINRTFLEGLIKDGTKSELAIKIRYIEYAEACWSAKFIDILDKSIQRAEKNFEIAKSMYSDNPEKLLDQYYTLLNNMYDNLEEVLNKNFDESYSKVINIIGKDGLFYKIFR